MIAFLTLCYCGLVWLVFFKLRLLPWNRTSQGAVVGVGVAGIVALVIAMNLFQPYSTDVRVYGRMVQIVPRVTGRVIEVPVVEHKPLPEGEVLFRIDPEPFQYAVDRLAADRKLKEIVLEDAKALAGAQVAARIKLDRAQAAYDEVNAQYLDAKRQLREATVYAPTEGFVANLALRPGQVASQLASMPVMTFVPTDRRYVIASFAQSALEYVRVGDPVEVAFERLPGRILGGEVESFIQATGQGQLPPSGTLGEWTTTPVPGRFAIRLALEPAADDLVIPAGTAGVAAVYTQRAQAIRIIRKVVIRMTSWLNFVIL